MATFKILVDGTFSGQSLQLSLTDELGAYIDHVDSLTPTPDANDNLFYVTASITLTGANEGLVYATVAHRLTGDVANSGDGKGVVFNIDANGDIVAPVSNAGFAAQLTVIESKVDNLDGDLVTHDGAIKTLIGTPTNVDISTDIANHDTKIDTRLGTPAGASVSADIAALQTSVDAIDNSDVLAILGTPAGASVSADIAANLAAILDVDADLVAHDASIDSQLSAISTTLGTPAGISMSADIAAIQSTVDGIDNTDVLAVLGTPAGVSVSADIAALQTEVEHVERADQALTRGELTLHVMPEWQPGGPEETSGGRDTIEGIQKITP